MSSAVTNSSVQALRAKRKLTQADFAAWLNEQMGRRYDKQRISRWESGREPVPEAVETFLRHHLMPPARTTAVVLAIANQKGGVAKTTTALNLCAAFRRLDQRALLVDVDPQGNATAAVGIDGESGSAPVTLAHVLLDRAPAASAIVATTFGFDVLPATRDLAAVEARSLSMPGRDTLLRRALQPLSTRYDYVVLDCAPSLGILTINALAAAHRVLVPVQTGRFAVDGVAELITTVEQVREALNPELDFQGVLPTMFNGGHAVDRQILADLQNVLGGLTRIYPPIPRATAFEQAAYQGQIALLASPNNPGALAYATLAEEIVHAG